MKNNFLRKALSVITVIALLLMTGMPFGGIDMSITANAETAVTIDLDDLNNGVTSGAGWYYNTSNDTLSIDWGYAATVTGETFTGKVTNSGTISGGEFSGAVSNEDGAVINGGTFSGTVTNCSGGEIKGGVFTKYSTVNNKPKGYIYGGEFYGTVTNETTISSTGNIVDGYISGGTFQKGSVITNMGRIQGGTFKEGSTIKNSGTITDDAMDNIYDGVITCFGSHTEKTPATCKEKAVCALCGQSYGDYAPHNYVNGVCSVCNSSAKITYTCGGTTYYTDDFVQAVTDLNNNGGGTVTLGANVDCNTSSNKVITQNIVLDLGANTLNLGTDTLVFEGAIEASVIGTGTITSTCDSNISESGDAVYVVNGASLTIGIENGNGPTIAGGRNSITTSNDTSNKLTVYSGTFNGFCHFSSTGGYNINIKGGTFNDEVYTNYTKIDGGTFNKNINCPNGSQIIVNDCDCKGVLNIGQQNTATKYVTLNGGVFEGGINNGTDGKTSAFLGTDVYYVDNEGQVIEIDEASDAGYDINQYVMIAPVHTVTFETNNYGGNDFTKKVADGFAVKEPTALTDEAASFDGWYKDDAFTTEWNFTTDTVTSDITLYAKWTVNQTAQVATPVFNPVSGTTFTDTLDVTITCATEDAEIYYTTDGSAPTSSSTKYTGAITLTESTAIKAIAVKTNMTDSEAASAEYTKTAQTAQVATPVFDPVSGTKFSDTLDVTITCATEDAEIYYTTDGKTPTSSSTKYTGAITLTSTKTIKAIAVKAGMEDSEVASAKYTKKTSTTPNPTPDPDPDPNPNPNPNPNPKPNPNPNPNPNPRPNPAPKPTPELPTDDVSSEAGIIEESDEIIFNDDTDSVTKVIIGFAGLIAFCAVMAARKKKKQ